VDALQQRLDRPDHRRVKDSLRKVGFGVVRVGSGDPLAQGEAVDLLATYAGQARHLNEWCGEAQINTDRNLRLQYLAGMWLNSYMGTEILASILAYYRFPDETFVGSPARVRALRRALQGAGRKEGNSLDQGKGEP
jgi:spermidine synthase